MAVNLHTRRETITMPGAAIVGTRCGSDGACCPDAFSPGTYDCEDPNLGTLPSTAIITVSGPTEEQGQIFSTWTADTSGSNNCLGSPWDIGYLHFLWAFPNQSYELSYLGLYPASTIGACIFSGNANCDYHVYALSLSQLLSGSINGIALHPTPNSVSSGSALPCCCDTEANLFYSLISLDYVLGTTGSDARLCAEYVQDFDVPCDFDQVAACSSEYVWYSKSIIDDCVGVACSGGSGIYLPNGDVLGGLYCNAGTIDQYPVRLNLKVFRNAFLYIPNSTTDFEEVCCQEDAFVVFKTYLVRRRSLNDGVADIINEPTIWAWSTTVPITFDANGTISGDGTATLNSCGLDCVFEDITVNVD